MDIHEIIGKVETLTPISNVSEKIAVVMADPDSSVKDIVEIISYDQILTLNLLRICNSSFIGLARKITSVKDAVTYMGIDKVACLAMVGNSAANFKKGQSGYDLEAGQLWHYSISSAMIARHLAETRRYPEISMIFTSALLKDIGKIILSDYVAPEYEAIVQAISANDISFDQAEKAVIGIDHAELGALATEKWNFNPIMVDIIRHHHNPDKATMDRTAVGIAHLADCICMMIGKGVGGDGLAYKYDADAMAALDVTASELQLAIAYYWDKIKEIEELVSLSEGA